MAKIPHSKIIQSQMLEYLQEAADTISRSCCEVSSHSEYRAIYKNSVGAFAPLAKLAQRNLALIKTAAGIVKRAPLLAASRQLQLASIELRRLIEVVTCYPYFVDHPVEWHEFQSNPGAGYAKDLEKPISWAAHRDIRWYADYALERYRSDRSGLVKEAISVNRRHYKELSRYVHAALDHMTKKPLTEAFDNVESRSLRDFGRRQKELYQSTLVLVCAPKPSAIGRLDVIERAWFDWTLGSARQKKIRSGDFVNY